MGSPYSEEFAMQTREMWNKQDAPENSREEITGMSLFVKVLSVRKHCRFITLGHHVRNEQRGGLEMGGLMHRRKNDEKHFIVLREKGNGKKPTG